MVTDHLVRPFFKKNQGPSGEPLLFAFFCKVSSKGQFAFRCLYFALDPWRFDILIRLCCGPCPPLLFQNMVMTPLNIENLQMIGSKGEIVVEPL